MVDLATDEWCGCLAPKPVRYSCEATTRRKKRKWQLFGQLIGKLQAALKIASLASLVLGPIKKKRVVGDAIKLPSYELAEW